MKTLSFRSSASQAGYAMLTVVLLASALGLVLLATTIDWTTVSGRQTDRHNEYQGALAAAEGATEKAIAFMVRDFKSKGDAEVNRNLTNYHGKFPVAGESDHWNAYRFGNVSGATNRTDVTRISVNNSVALEDYYKGLRGAVSTYRVASTARLAEERYKFVAVVEQEVMMTSIPIFQFAIFYNNLLEFTWAAPLTVRGRVHSNGDIYTGSAAALTFKSDVTAFGITQKMAWYGKKLGDYSASITYDVGYLTNQNKMVVPIVTNNTPSVVVKKILEIPPPPEEESIDSALGQERYYNKAELIIIVDHDGGVTVDIKKPYDTTTSTVPWGHAKSFIDTSETFTDQRQNKEIVTTEIDIAKMILWAATSPQVIAKLGVAKPPQTVYVIDRRKLKGNEQHGVRLVNGETLPSRGLTVATPNPLYVLGNFNQPKSSWLNTTNTSNTQPASLVSDALTVLSEDWEDEDSDKSYSKRRAAPTTVNAAIITGAVVSGANGTPFSGGVVNLPRLLEDWDGERLTINGSMVNLFESTEATAVFKDPGYYYRAPSRDFNFDTNFLDPEKMPPGTPVLRVMIRGKWSNPAPPT